jgi:DNA-binding IclR family transcriptional regulator
MTPTPRGIQSLEVGGSLLRALADAGRPLPLKDLAARAGMSPAKAHAYLVSWGRVGLVAQDGAAGPYGLGPLAMTLGLISLQQHDPVRLASEALEPLALATGCTVALTLWGNAGPTVVRVAEAPSPLHVSLRHGTVLNLRQTASGRAMAAHRPDEEVATLWRAEWRLAHPETGTQPDVHPDAEARAWAAFQAELQAVRQVGHASSDDALMPGLSALAVPGCDALGVARWAFVAVATGRQWADAAARARVLDALQTSVWQVRQRLGWVPTGPTRPAAPP